MGYSKGNVVTVESMGRDIHCWEKHGSPGNNQDQNNQAAEGVVEQEEEVALVGLCIEDNNEPQEPR